MSTREPDEFRASRTGDARATDGAFANTGVVNGSVTFGSPTIPGLYRQRIQDIAPADLVGRERELAELSAFCTAPDAGRYAWWQAPAWSGKSALMAWFALHPPAGVRLVSFFISARDQHQSGRDAFLDAVIEQLAELLTEPKPQWTVYNQDLVFKDLLARAAERHRTGGERLVLLVDGLDEDAAFAVPSGGHSIAALLPVPPPAGMQVIVTGRPIPRLSFHLPHDHPLLRQSTIVDLARSPQAVVAKEVMRQELDNLVLGHPAGHDLLGLLTVAGGGLSSADLATLTGLPVREIERYFTTVAGRSILSQPSPWHAATSPRGYVLGHDGLRNLAEPEFESGNQERRERLSRWADGFQARRWPSETPDYLLKPYAQMLRLAGDLTRLAACATDPCRHEWMRTVTGGDTEAIREISETMDLVLAAPEPDLAVLGRLAVHHSRLAERNSEIPRQLPAAWVHLGDYPRAEALARSIPHPADRMRALVDVAGAAAQKGDQETAEALAFSIDDPHTKQVAVRRVAVAIAADAPERAEALAGQIDDHYQKARALAAVAESVAAKGDRRRTAALVDRVLTLVPSIDDSMWRFFTLFDLASALVGVGDVEAAVRLIDGYPDPYRRAIGLAGLAEAVVAAGQTDRARSIAHEAELIERAQPDASGLRTAVSSALAVTGEFERARDRARAHADPARQVEELTDLAITMARSGLGREAGQLVEDAETLSRAIKDSREHVRASASLAKAFAATGDTQKAVAAARTLTDPASRADVLVHLATTAAAVENVDLARELLTEAERPARSWRNLRRDDERLERLCAALARSGDAARAESVARLIDDPVSRERAARSPRDSAIGESPQRRPAGRHVGGATVVIDDSITSSARLTILSVRTPDQREETLAALAEATAAAGDHDRAEKMIRLLLDEKMRHQALTVLAVAVAEGGDYQRADALVQSIRDQSERYRALGAVSEAAARSGAYDRAEALTVSIPDPGRRVGTLNELAGIAAAAGDFDRAEALARIIAEPQPQALALARVAVAMAEAGGLDRAAELAENLGDSTYRSYVLADLVEIAAAARQFDRAEALARAVSPAMSHDQAVGFLVEALTSAGEVERAAGLTALIIGNRARAEALAVVAGRAERNSAARLITEAFRLGDWSVPLRAAATISPGVLSAVADELLLLAAV